MKSAAFGPGISGGARQEGGGGGRQNRLQTLQAEASRKKRRDEALQKRLEEEMRLRIEASFASTASTESLHATASCEFDRKERQVNMLGLPQGGPPAKAR